MRLRNDDKGMTLSEIIITFALMGIFLAAVIAVITSAIRTQSELTGTMYAQSVGEILLDKVTGELAFAQVSGSPAIKTGTVLKDGEVLGGGVTFYDREGRMCSFYAEDGILQMQGESNWRMDENAYMGYRVTAFEVVRLNEKNVFEAKITIRNLKTGFEYSASKTIESFNFRTENDYRRITEGNIFPEK